MKKNLLFASLIVAFATAANAQVEGFGWDNQTREAVVRLGLGGYSHAEGGLGLQWDNGAPDDNQAQKDAAMTVSLSGRYLLALHNWERLTGYLHLGVYFRDDQVNENGAVVNRKGSLAFFGGYEPEVQLIPHLAVSFRFGALLNVMPDVGLGLIGNDISIVQGFNFRILL